MDPKQLMLMLMAQQQGNGAPPELSGIPMRGAMAGMQAGQLPMQPPAPPVGFDSPTGILPPDSPAGHVSIPFFRDQAQARANEQAKSRAQFRSQMMKPQFGGAGPRSSAN